MSKKFDYDGIDPAKTFRYILGSGIDDRCISVNPMIFYKSKGVVDITGILFEDEEYENFKPYQDAKKAFIDKLNQTSSIDIFNYKETDSAKNVLKKYMDWNFIENIKIDKNYSFLSTGIKANELSGMKCTEKAMDKKLNIFKANEKIDYMINTVALSRDCVTKFNGIFINDKKVIPKSYVRVCDIDTVECVKQKDNTYKFMCIDFTGVYSVEKKEVKFLNNPIKQDQFNIINSIQNRQSFNVNQFKAQLTISNILGAKLFYSVFHKHGAVSTYKNNDFEKHKKSFDLNTKDIIYTAKIDDDFISNMNTVFSYKVNNIAFDDYFDKNKIKMVVDECIKQLNIGKPYISHIAYNDLETATDNLLKTCETLTDANYHMNLKTLKTQAHKVKSHITIMNMQCSNDLYNSIESIINTNNSHTDIINMYSKIQDGLFNSKDLEYKSILFNKQHELNTTTVDYNILCDKYKAIHSGISPLEQHKNTIGMNMDKNMGMNKQTVKQTVKPMGSMGLSRLDDILSSGAFQPQSNVMDNTGFQKIATKEDVINNNHNNHNDHLKSHEDLIMGNVAKRLSFNRKH